MGKAKFFNPFNFNIYNSLGECYFALAEKKFDNPKERDSFLEKAIKYFSKSIKLNPFYLNSHFNSAQAYFNYKYPLRVNFDKAFEEFKKTAYMTYHDYEALFYVSEIYLLNGQLFPPG